MGYTVTVGGQSPNVFFVTFPDEDALQSALEALGLSPCVGDCLPQRCNSLFLEGFLQESEDLIVGDAIKQAYVEANPGVSIDDLKVNITNIEGDLEDING